MVEEKKKEMAVLSTKNYSGKERNERRRYKTQQALDPRGHGVCTMIGLMNECYEER